MQHLLEINENKQKTEKLFSYPILCPLCHLHQRKQIKMKLIQFRIYSNVADYVLCTPTNDECKFPNWKCVLRKCTVFSYIAIPGVERDSSHRAPMIMFNTYMTQFTCSHDGILIHERITTFLDAKRKSKRTCFLCE